MAVAEHLVGRAAELDSFDRSSTNSSGPCVRARARREPGIGKTRLLAELAARADARGCLVLTGSASELEATCRSRCSSTHSTSTSRAWSGSGSRCSTTTCEPSSRRSCRRCRRSPPAAACRSSTSVTERTGPSAPCSSRWLPRRLVLVLDDLHWADPGSVELVGALLRRPPAAPVLMAVAVRPRQVPDRLIGLGAGASREADSPRAGALTLGEAGAAGAGRDRASASVRSTRRAAAIPSTSRSSLGPWIAPAPRPAAMGSRSRGSRFRSPLPCR